MTAAEGIRLGANSPAGLVRHLACSFVVVIEITEREY
jgi:hypothetical protein